MTFAAGIGALFALVLGFLTGGFGIPHVPNLLHETEEATSGLSILTDIDSLGGYINNGGDVLYRGERVAGADPKTFTVIDAYYAKDAAHVYYNLEPLSPTSTADILAGADPRTFALCDSGDDRDDCAKDDAHVYVEGKIVPGADPRTFAALDSYYGKDASHVYYAGAILAGADSASFVTVTGDAMYDAQDKTSRYLKGKPVTR